MPGPRSCQQETAAGTGADRARRSPGHFTSCAGRNRKASGHDAVLPVLRMARNAADAADVARPKGGNFQHRRPRNVFRSLGQTGPGAVNRPPDYDI